MTGREFDQMLAGTKFGRVGPGSKSLAAARLHFVGRIDNMADCARRAGCSPQSARECIARIRGLVRAAQMEPVTVLVPRGMRGDIERAAERLRDLNR